MDTQPLFAEINWNVVLPILGTGLSALFLWLSKDVFPAFLAELKARREFRQQEANAQRQHDLALTQASSTRDQIKDERLFELIDKNTGFLAEMRQAFPRIVELLIATQEDVTELRIDVASIATVIQHELPSKKLLRKRAAPAQSEPASTP